MLPLNTFYWIRQFNTVFRLQALLELILPFSAIILAWAGLYTWIHLLILYADPLYVCLLP